MPSRRSKVAMTGIQLNRTPIRAFLRQTTMQTRSADSISRTNPKVSGARIRLAPSIDAPFAERLRTVQVMRSLPKLILPALKILRRGVLRFSPIAASGRLERAGAPFETRIEGSGCVPDAISWSAIAGIADAGLVLVKPDLIFPEKSRSACISKLLRIFLRRTVPGTLVN